MKTQVNIKAMLLVPVLLAFAPLTDAAITGISGTECDGAGSACFDLTARTGHIALGDGNSLLAWGYANANGADVMQYPGPTLIVNQDDRVTVTLTNDLADPVSIVFPGQVDVTASGGSAGLVTQEAAPGGTDTVTYTFTVSEPGTYMYQSGTQPEIQLEMGLVGAIIVRPTGFDATDPAKRTAYGTAATAYDREFLFFLGDMDRSAHEGLDGGIPIDPASYSATLWFINGRNGPDTLLADSVAWLPSQPYGALVQAEPSERVLMRLLGGGRDLHPFHHHGNNSWQIAQDGRVLQSAPGAEAGYPDYVETGGAVTDGSVDDWLPNDAALPDQAVSNYTITIAPGATYDSIFTWTGRDMNWDIYGDRPGHSSADCDTGGVSALLPSEDPNGHCKDLSVKLPEQQALGFGGLWSGSPFLGTTEALPPLTGGLNPAGGYSFIWHSHTERELTNDDVFPGGMMTFIIVQGPGTLPAPGTPSAP